MKRTLTVMLALFMALTLFSACGSKEPGGSAASATDAAAPEVTPEAPAASETDVPAEPEPAAPEVSVEDAVNYTKEAVPAVEGMDCDWLHRVVLPRITLESDAARVFNESIMELSAVDKLEAGEEGYELYDISYDYSITDGLIAIAVTDTMGWQASEVSTGYFGYYFDVNADRELTVDEYLDIMGTSYDELFPAAREAALASLDSETSVEPGDCVMYKDGTYFVEVTGVFEVSGYPWAMMAEVNK